MSDQFHLANLGRDSKRINKISEIIKRVLGLARDLAGLAGSPAGQPLLPPHEGKHPSLGEQEETQVLKKQKQMNKTKPLTENDRA